MWNNNTLIDAWFVLTYKKTMIFWITVYWMLLFVNVVSGAPPSRLCQCFCFHAKPCTNTMYLKWFSLTLTPLPWYHDLFFILYAFALYYDVCMYPLCTTCAFAIIIYILNYNVFPCVLLVDNYVSLNQSNLNFHFWHCDFDDLYGEVDVFIRLYWFLHLILICIDDVYDKY